jgi:DNA-binding response OmpR family regulator
VDTTEANGTSKHLQDTYRESILIVENEEDIRCLLTDILVTEGHKVLSASNGIDALELFNQEQFDMVLTDLGMPVMSGWEVASTIKKIAPDVIIAVITGWGTQLDKCELDKNGVDIVVNKPFRVQQILNMVQAAREIKNSMGRENPKISPPGTCL